MTIDQMVMPVIPVATSSMFRWARRRHMGRATLPGREHRDGAAGLAGVMGGVRWEP